jgi:sugar phosphate isomerase/epimerase
MKDQKNSSRSSDHNRIGRREFLQKTSAAAVALSFPMMPSFSKDKPMGIVVHSYASRWNPKEKSEKYPGFLNAIDLLEHCHEIGAAGIQVIVRDWTSDFAKKVRERRENLGLYIEGSVGVPKSEAEVGKFENDVVKAKESGARVLRTVCTSGRRYESYPTFAAFKDAKSAALTSLRLAEPVLRKHKMKLAVENHKDWRATELVEIIKTLNSEWIGVTLDFGNSIALMEDPMKVVETLAPYMFTTHVKDMGLDEYTDGFLLSEVPLGKGMLDLPAIIATCRKHNPETTYNLEMITRDPLEIPCLKEEYWATFEGVQGSELARTLRMVRQHKFKSTLPKVSHLSNDERLAEEEQNILTSLTFSKESLGLK